METALAICCSIVGFFLLCGHIGIRRWRKLAQKSSAEFLRWAEGSADATWPPVLPMPESSGLPQCVERYFAFAFPQSSNRLPAQVQLRQSGSMHIKEHSSDWSDFAAVQHITARRPGFLWLADMRAGTLPIVFVSDSYSAGQGATRAWLLGLVRLADSSGSRESAEASLMRWLAEGAWLPTSLLPRDEGREGCTLAWSALADERALASLRDGEIMVELEFRFNPSGEIVSVYSPARYRQVGASMLPTPWEGRFSDYALMGGMMIPRRAEVGWIIDGYYRPYWRGRIEAAEYS